MTDAHVVVDFRIAGIRHGEKRVCNQEAGLDADDSGLSCLDKVPMNGVLMRESIVVPGARRAT